VRCGSGRRIVPFRGEYYELIPSRRFLVTNLIYPVPDPSFRFWEFISPGWWRGVSRRDPMPCWHSSEKDIFKTDIRLRDLADTLSYPGF
jgi:L-2-hydroxyglutarate oxidase